ncbi:hypothetical protein VQ02_10255 [Methylobacterium variabile]|uniref:Uncharacterized protein n=2 Tax=Methylobacterium variabile TaxID=298794 RepID=A0A0J6T144_9HYPH|nr:hypothetical protein VQ02_10255 [Methylobacterium variabile]
MRTATGLADRNYQQYINNLGTAAQSYGTGLAGQGQGYAAQASAAQGLGTQLASLGQVNGQNQAGVYGTAAQQQAQFGQGVAGLQMSAADALVKNNNTLAQGQTQSSNNFLGALLGGASSVFGAAGKAGGFGNLFK